ncbi:uncharacterized protein V1516DRAFT_620444 [Lipomyces oligophaga]|uniref:uncharacterized protein n=1 Tax=Lipomyces oligophaga TaxID=45792 RepID=UPI0034CDF84E
MDGSDSTDLHITSESRASDSAFSVSGLPEYGPTGSASVSSDHNVVDSPGIADKPDYPSVQVSKQESESSASPTTAAISDSAIAGSTSAETRITESTAAESDFASSEPSQSSSPTPTSVSSTATSTAAKKSFKSQSLNTIFRKLQATSSSTQKSSSETSSSPQLSRSLLGTGGKLRNNQSVTMSVGSFTLAPLQRNLSLSPQPGSAGTRPGFASNMKSTSQLAWRRVQARARSSSNSQPSQREMSEEELKKMGIHLTERISETQRDLGWDDEDDDVDDWDTIEFGDGTKVVVSHDHPNEEVPEPSSTGSDASQGSAAEKPQVEQRENNSQPAGTSRTSSSPWAPIPQVSQKSVSKLIAEDTQHRTEQHYGSMPGRSQFQYGMSHSPHINHRFDMEDSFQGHSRRNYNHFDHEMPPWGSGDVRSQLPPLVLPRERSSELEFDRSYGARSGTTGGELYNDRSGQFEPARRVSFNSKRPILLGPTTGTTSSIGRERDTDEAVTPGFEMRRRGSSSAGTSHSRQILKGTEDDLNSKSSLSPTISTDAMSLGSNDLNPPAVNSSIQSPSSKFVHPEIDDPIRRESELLARQEQVMKSSLENARKRKEEERRLEEERLQAARKRAQLLDLAANEAKNSPSEIPKRPSPDETKHQILKSKESNSADIGKANVKQQKPQNSNGAARLATESAFTPAAKSASKDLGSRFLRSETESLKSKRKESFTSSEGPDMEESVAAAIESLISDSNSGHSPPVKNVSMAKQQANTAGWESEQKVSDRPWLSNSVSMSRGNHPNVWGPVGSKSRYGQINGMEHRPSLISHSHGDHSQSGGDWASRHSPAQLSDNWRRPFSAAPSKQGDSTISSQLRQGTSSESTSDHHLHNHGPVGSGATPSSSPLKSTTASSPQTSSPGSAIEKATDDSNGQLRPGNTQNHPQQSSRTWSRFFPSNSNFPSQAHTASTSGGPSASPPGGVSFSGISDDAESQTFFLDMNKESLDRSMDEYLFMPQSVQNLSDESGPLKPKVHLPQISSGQQPQSPDLGRLEGHQAFTGGSRYSSSGYHQLEIPEGTFTSPGTSSAVSGSFGLGGMAVGSSIRETNNLGFIGSKVPSINSIKAVQSRIALTLGHVSDGGRTHSLVEQSTGNASGLSFSMQNKDLTMASSFEAPVVTQGNGKLEIRSVSPFEFLDDLSEDSKEKVWRRYKVNLGEYSKESQKPFAVPADGPEEKTIFDMFATTKVVPNNFVGIVTSAVSSASPASNPFNPSRRNGGSSAYKIMLPGLTEHILIPVNVDALAGSTGSYHGYRGGASDKYRPRRSETKDRPSYDRTRIHRHGLSTTQKSGQGQTHWQKVTESTA